ncbi:MAG: lamin tail domain-containing protein [Polyangiaceae bacterium]
MAGALVAATLGWAAGCASSGDGESLKVTREALLVSSDLVISQVFGGGGNANAPYTHDFVELMNRGASPVSLAGKAIQYAAAGSNFNGATAVALPAVTLAPGQYFLVQLSSNGNVGSALPTPDLVTSGMTALALSASQGKVALVDAAAPLDACGSALTPCSTAAFTDLVGYGVASQSETSATPTLSNTTAAIRLGGGCLDTGDNGADFAIGSPLPRTTASALAPCSAPADAGSDVANDAGADATSDAADSASDAAVDANDASVPVDVPATTRAGRSTRAPSMRVMPARAPTCCGRCCGGRVDGCRGRCGQCEQSRATDSGVADAGVDANVDVARASMPVRSTPGLRPASSSSTNSAAIRPRATTRPSSTSRSRRTPWLVARRLLLRRLRGRR